MSILRDILDIRDIKAPTFFKEFNARNKQLDDLEKLYEKVKSKKRNVINKDILNLKAGLEGEKNVSYELKNSFIPMICIHDIRIQHEDYIAQLDFVLITEYFIMVLETKKLNGDIVINQQGEFVRKFKNNYGKVIKEEGMYSPIAQNDRHIRILESMLKQNEIIRNIPIYSTVVIANPKSIINRTKAPANIKNSIIKYDQITDMLTKKLKKHKEQGKIREKQMIEIANFLIENNTEITFDYYKKYGLSEEDFKEEIKENAIEEIQVIKDQVIKEIVVEVTNKGIEESIVKAIDDKHDELFEKLRKYRYGKAMEEGVKPYFIFNNNTLEEIIKVRPRNKDELLKVQGFGKVKVEKYGEDIVGIVRG